MSRLRLKAHWANEGKWFAQTECKKAGDEPPDVISDGEYQSGISGGRMACSVAGRVILLPFVSGWSMV